MTEIKYLTHREAAQARLNGEKLLSSGPCSGRVNLTDAMIDTPSPYYRAPRVFTHPGGTCPAPETEAPGRKTMYWVPDFYDDGLVYGFRWDGDDIDKKRLSRGLVYLTREAAIARAELMLAGAAK